MALSAIVLVLALCLAGIGCLIAAVRVTDAAGEAARLAARGDEATARSVALSLAPPGSLLTLSGGEVVTARVSAPPLGGWLPGIRIAAVALAARACDRREDGVATVLACVCAMAMIALTGLVVQLGAAVLARHRAAGAADLGALAGAAVVLSGEHVACDRAGAIAAANGAEVRSCRLDEADILIVVTVAVHVGPLTGTATAAARAGPVGNPTG